MHFAPEWQLENKIRSLQRVGYYTADIEEGRAEYVVDITNIQFEDAKFDYIIANHVMEHIPDEAKAISEMKRCLKADGTIILSFPVCLNIDTLENEEYDTEELRTKYYGQKDHVRLYGKDYKERLEKYGLRVESFSPEDYLDDEEIARYGVIRNDIVILCKRMRENNK